MLYLYVIFIIILVLWIHFMTGIVILYFRQEKFDELFDENFRIAPLNDKCDIMQLYKYIINTSTISNCYSQQLIYRCMYTLGDVSNNDMLK